ncbi:unnamed protein product [Peniophora sp. CBMAI 1063]|nr:unnamed protein product [Peniophora sp. CBMAI 1063]
MMKALDPTYPLYPIVEIFSTVLLLLVLATSVVRHSWNLGVLFLCFWLPLELVGSAAGHIIWSDNGHGTARFHTFCDIFSRLQLVCYVVKPMSTLILSRRLYMIASLRPINLECAAARRWNFALEWTLGIGVPLIVAGPLYYVLQRYRFVVKEGFGCANSHAHSILSILLIEGWLVVPPLLSAALYYPKVIKTFYCQRRDIERFLQSDGPEAASHVNYARLLILASVDILLMLPCGLASIILYTLELEPIPFHSNGIHIHHHNHTMIKTVTYEELTSGQAGSARMARIYFLTATSPVLAFTIFGLFGVTSEARASYRRIIRTVTTLVGWRPASLKHVEAHSSLGPIEFGERTPTHVTLSDIGMRPSPVDLVDQESKSKYASALGTPDGEVIQMKEVDHDAASYIVS